MAEQSRACWGCGAEPAEGAKFQRCMRCAEAKLPSSYFCGEECMLANWPRHKAWHKEQTTYVKHLESTSAPVHDRSMAKSTARWAERTGDECSKLHAHAMTLSTQGDYLGSAKAFRKLIKMRPDDGAGYHDLAVTLDRSNRFVESLQLYLKAMELYEDGDLDWAQATAVVFCRLLNDDECRKEPKPEWWNDEDLKALSARVVAAINRAMPTSAVHSSTKEYAFEMRACVLSAHAVVVQPSWNTGARTAEQIKEAALCFRLASAARGGLPETMRQGQAYDDKMASMCDVVWACMHAEEAATREAAEAVAAAARKEAEAKAAAVAEELLAEEEKEKEQAAAKNKGRGKGKKGKGKRS